MAQYKKHAIRQGLLPATDCEGRHSSEDISHQLAKDILDIHHTGLFQDFHNWRSINSPTMPQSQKDLDDLLQTYFNATEYRHLSIPSRTNFSKYLQSYYQIANDYNAQKFQCQYCKKRFAKHFIMPMYPQHSHLNEANTFLFCWGCLQAANGQDHMIHPGPWLNTTEESERSKTNQVLDLNILTNRPWSLQTLDQDYDTDFMPYTFGSQPYPTKPKSTMKPPSNTFGTTTFAGGDVPLWRASPTEATTSHRMPISFKH